MPQNSKNNRKKTTAPKISRSSGSLGPGDLITFSYHLPPNTSPKIKAASRGARIALVVSNNSGEGVFTANTGNKLLSCFTLTEVGPEIRELIVTKLYKKRRLSNYYKIIKSLKSILGKDSYRTYILNKLSNLREINIDI
jgi:hypothetical protein